MKKIIIYVVIAAVVIFAAWKAGKKLGFLKAD